MKPQISCIIPFYNEAPRIQRTINALTKSKYISEIICIDDGSTDSPKIKTSQSPIPVKLIQLTGNLGKSHAVHEGFKHSAGDIVFLIDADLQDIRIDEIDRGCRIIKEHNDIDMIIFKSTQGTWITQLCRQDIVLSGARLLRKKDLQQIFLHNPYRYQLEVAINYYMQDHKKRYYFTLFSAFNTLRSKKIPMLPATIELIQMLYSIYRYRGYTRYLMQLFTFCHEEIS